jgi:hypothetical protein
VTVVRSREDVEAGSAAYYLWLIYDQARTNRDSYAANAEGVHALERRGVAAVFANLMKHAERGLETLGYEVPR